MKSNNTSKNVRVIRSKEKINCKHKVFVSRFEPPLYSLPSPPWRVSTIHRGTLQGLLKIGVPNSTNTILYRRGISTRTRRNK